MLDEMCKLVSTAEKERTDFYKRDKKQFYTEFNFWVI